MIVVVTIIVTIMIVTMMQNVNEKVANAVNIILTKGCRPNSRIEC